MHLSLIRLPDVKHHTRLSWSTIDTCTAGGTLPKYVALSGQAFGQQPNWFQRDCIMRTEHCRE